MKRITSIADFGGLIQWVKFLAFICEKLTIINAVDARTCYRVVLARTDATGAAWMSERAKSALKAAQNMIERYGDKALAEVDLRISELGSREQLEAQNFWSEIREIVRFLLEDGSDESRH